MWNIIYIWNEEQCTRDRFLGNCISNWNRWSRLSKAARKHVAAFSLVCWTYFFETENGGDMFLRIVIWNSTDYTASYTRRWYSSYFIGLFSMCVTLTCFIWTFRKCNQLQRNWKIWARKEAWKSFLTQGLLWCDICEQFAYSNKLQHWLVSHKGISVNIFRIWKLWKDTKLKSDRSAWICENISIKFNNLIK
jgi:hypothetical protein